MYGGLQFHPHVVEFIRGVGVRYDGVVVQDAGGNGPFSWVLPDDVAVIQRVEIISGGCGGQGGGDIASPLSLGGGAGGPSGNSRIYRDVMVLPGATLTVTIGAGGAGGAVNGTGGSGGGDTSIAGVLSGHAFGSTPTTLLVIGTGMYYPGIGASSSAIDTPGGGSAAGADGADEYSPTNGDRLVDESQYGTFGGAQGGGGRASGAVGAQGGARYYGFAGVDSGGVHAAGTNAGGVSRGGGGQGGLSLYGRGGLGGSNSVGGNAVGYGAGGGGGAGGFAGGNGGDGYARLLYWSVR